MNLEAGKLSALSVNFSVLPPFKRILKLLGQAVEIRPCRATIY